MRHFKFFFGACLLLLALSGVCLGQTAGSVTKYDKGNPTIGIVKYTGDATGRAVLETMLSKCDWFQVLKAAQAERASVRLSVSASNGAYAANVSASGEGGKSFRVDGVGKDWNESAAKLTDAILKELFGVPALCTRPIAYVVTSGGMKEIYTCRVDGSAQTRLTHNNALSSEPSWGHSGALVYTLNKSNSLKIVLVDVANSRQRTISSARGLNASAALSSNGRLVALALSLGKQVDLYLVDLSDGKPVRMTQDRDVESSPVFSPDGKQICFVSDKSGRPQLYLVSVDGGDARRLTSGASECVSPDWSPRSKLICCSTRVNGQYVIATLDPSKPGEKPVVVTEAAGQWEAPSWAPDGRHVVCTRSTGGTQDLYLVDTWFHTFLPLTKGAHISLPAWAPAR
ncbi:MAG: hypothetical protein MJ202_11095 [Lentisphaeria bacterium]|nr:hypothetical protein [Lentisphaeria bacterium]